MSRKYLMTGAAALILSLAACSQNSGAPEPEQELPVEAAQPTEESDTQQETVPTSTDSTSGNVSPEDVNKPDYSAVLTIDTRPVPDLDLDPMRKPAEVLEFIGLKPGWTVLELEAGDGYYTELMANTVGPNGVIYMQNPVEFDEFLGDAVSVRLADQRLPNVRYLQSDFDAIPLSQETAHVITWILGPHELWFTPENKPDGFGDPAQTFASLKEILRPNGRLVVLDHAAAAGAPETTGGTTHRIDPELIVALAEAAGFVIEKRSDILANPDDDYEKNVFDPEVRRNTDRFLISFKKAEAAE